MCHLQRRIPEVCAHEAKPYLTGHKILKMAKMGVHFKNRLLDGALGNCDSGLSCISKIL